MAPLVWRDAVKQARNRELRRPKVYHDGAMTFEHDFKQPGHYVGIVTGFLWYMLRQRAQKTPAPAAT